MHGPYIDLLRAATQAIVVIHTDRLRPHRCGRLIGRAVDANSRAAIPGDDGNRDSHGWAFLGMQDLTRNQPGATAAYRYVTAERGHRAAAGNASAASLATVKNTVAGLEDSAAANLEKALGERCLAAHRRDGSPSASVEVDYRVLYTIGHGSGG